MNYRNALLLLSAFAWISLVAFAPHRLRADDASDNSPAAMNADLQSAITQIDNLKDEETGSPDQRQEYAAALQKAALLYEKLGQSDRAEPLYREAIALAGPEMQDADKSNIWHHLGLVYLDMGDYSMAEQCMQKAAYSGNELLETSIINWRERGETAMVDQTEAGLFQSVGADVLSDWGRALAAIGDSTSAAKRFGQGLQLVRQRHAMGFHNDQNLARILNDFGAFYLETNDLASAEPLIRQGMQIRAQSFQTLPDYADSLETMASLYAAKGDYSQGEQLCRQALDIRRQSQGETHTDFTRCLVELAQFELLLGKSSEAHDLSRQALDTLEQNISRAAGMQSERQQLQMQAANRPALDLYLTLTPGAEVLAAKAYEPVLLWKGAVTLRQRQIRALRVQAPQQMLPAEVVQPKSMDMGVFNVLVPPNEAAQNAPKVNAPESVASACARLETLSSTLAQTVLCMPDHLRSGQLRDQRTTTTDTENEIESLQERLAAASDASGVKLHVTTVNELTQALPPNVALIDMIQYANYSSPPSQKGPLASEDRLTAFVLRAGQDVKRIDLGPIADIQTLVTQWRQTYGSGAAGNAAGAQLRKLIWEPLLPLLGNSETVLISPDGPLLQFPFAALPGSRPGHYLIEDLSLAIVSVPQALPDMLAAAAPTGNPSLLVVGDVDYSAQAPATPSDVDMPDRADFQAALNGQTAAPHQRRRRPSDDVSPQDWPALPGTDQEVASVQSAFKKIFPAAPTTQMSQSNASPSTLCDQAGQFRYVHLATHGFFDRLILARSENNAAGVSAVQDIRTRQQRMLDIVRQASTMPEDQREQFYRQQFQPQGTDAPPEGLMQQGVAPQIFTMIRPTFAPEDIFRFHPALRSGLVLSGGDRAGGILTALQIEQLNLDNVDLATLSACETGLGERSQGDGVLGLQRSFQIAGARSVVATLWCVEDQPTQKLMTHFYENLWGKNMGKLQALRAAQLELLSEGAQAGPERGFRVAGAATQPQQSDNAMSPRYWAAFQLSGDWR